MFNLDPTTPERFWLVHSVIKSHPLSEGIAEVKEFLAQTQDIMVWDSHSFELGFNQEWPTDVHQEYQQLLQDEFGPWWVKPGSQEWTLTLDEIWNQPGLAAGQGRIIHMYELKKFFDAENFFPNIPERWGNKDEPEELKQYLDERTAEARASPEEYHPWRPNCQMTPTGPDIIFHKLVTDLSID